MEWLAALWNGVKYLFQAVGVYLFDIVPTLLIVFGLFFAVSSYREGSASFLKALRDGALLSLGGLAVCLVSYLVYERPVWVGWLWRAIW